MYSPHYPTSPLAAPLLPCSLAPPDECPDRLESKYGKKIIYFREPLLNYPVLKLISKMLSRKKGKINTIQHGQGEKHRLRIFSPSTPPAKVEQLIAWPRREKMKTQGENTCQGQMF